jgi:phenylalanyl-tRNA synthetase beta chain
MGVTGLELRAASPPSMHPGRSAEVVVGGDVIGVIGELHPRVAVAFGIEGRVAAGELRIETLLEDQPPFIVTEVSPYPPVIFDLAFDLPDDAAAALIVATVRSAAPELVERIDIFDVFRGAPLEERRKSLAMRVIMRADDRTLTDDEITPVRQAMSDKVDATHDGRLRSG